jgi:hypothetical protein
VSAEIPSHRAAAAQSLTSRHSVCSPGLQEPRTPSRAPCLQWHRPGVRLRDCATKQRVLSAVEVGPPEGTHLLISYINKHLCITYCVLGTEVRAEMKANVSVFVELTC